jgi:hypothetical protein
MEAALIRLRRDPSPPPRGFGQHKVADVLRLGARLYTAGLTGLAEIFWSAYY